MPSLSEIAFEEISETKKLLEVIELRQPPSIHNTELLDFLKNLCDYSLNEVVNISKNPNYIAIKKDPQIEQILNRMILLASYVGRQIHSYCDSFDYAERLNISSAARLLLNKLLMAGKIHRAFIIHGTTDFNYMYSPIGQRLNKLASHLTDKIPPLDNSFAILSFPLASSNNILANCNLVHEMGHLIVDSEDLPTKLYEKLGKDKKNKIENIIEKYTMIGNQYDLQFAQRKAQSHEILGSWIHETMADFIGIHLLGPAYLFAFIQFVESLGAYTRDDDEHPCSTTRLKIMTNELARLEWETLIKQECITIWQRLEEIKRLQIEKNTHYDASNECLPLILEDILQIVKEICDRHTYKPRIFLSDKDHIYALLERGIPPAEKMDNKSNDNKFYSFDILSIINAGWFFREKNYPTWKERFSNLDSIQNKELLNRLITKAMEINFVREATD